MARYLKKLSLVVCMVVALATMVEFQAKMVWAAAVSNSTVPPTCSSSTYNTSTPLPNLYSPSTSPEVLLVEDRIPWDHCMTSTTHPTAQVGVIEYELEQIGKKYDRINSGTFKTYTANDFIQYRIVFFAGDQSQILTQFYTHINSNLVALEQAMTQRSMVLIANLDGTDPVTNIDTHNIIPFSAATPNWGYTADTVNPTTNLDTYVRYDTPKDCTILSTLRTSYAPWNNSADAYFANIPTAATAFSILSLYDGTAYRTTLAKFSTPTTTISAPPSTVIATTMNVEYAFAANLNTTLLGREITCAQTAIATEATLEALEAKLDLLTSSIASISAALVTLQADVNAIDTKSDAIESKLDCLTPWRKFRNRSQSDQLNSGGGLLNRPQLNLRK